MGRIAKQKRQLIEESNKRILGEQLRGLAKSVVQTNRWVDDVKDTHQKVKLSLPANACKIQSFLISRGFLPKGSDDCDFGDESAKALGKYVENKLDIILNISTLQDLQDILKEFGFDTGSYGFGPLMSKKVSEFINLLENLKENILNSKELFDIVKKIVNFGLIFTNGKKLNSINHYKTDAWLYCDLFINQPLSLLGLTIDNIDKKSIKISGYVGGKLLIGLCDNYYVNQQYMKYRFESEIEYDIIIKDGKICINLNFVSARLDSVSTNFELKFTWWSIYVFNNSVYLDKGKFLGYKVGKECVHYIDLERELGNRISSVCLSIENIVKVLSGKISVTDISSDIVEIKRPDQKKGLRNLCVNKSGNSAPKKSRTQDDGTTYPTWDKW